MRCGRAAMLGHLPSATQSQNDHRQWWNRGEEEADFEHRAPGGAGYSGRSPLVIEMAREIENLKRQLAAFQTGPINPQGGMEKNADSVAESDLVDRHSPSTVKTNCAGSLLSIRCAGSISPNREDFGKQDLEQHDNIENFIDGVGGGRKWMEDGGFELDQLPLVVELRAQVARLEEQLRRSIPTANADDNTRRLTQEKNSASAAESKTVAHLRRVIQVTTIS